MRIPPPPQPDPVLTNILTSYATEIASRQSLVFDHYFSLLKQLLMHVIMHPQKAVNVNLTTSMSIYLCALALKFQLSYLCIRILLTSEWYQKKMVDRSC